VEGGLSSFCLVEVEEWEGKREQKGRHEVVSTVSNSDRAPDENLYSLLLVVLDTTVLHSALLLPTASGDTQRRHQADLAFFVVVAY